MLSHRTIKITSRCYLNMLGHGAPPLPALRVHCLPQTEPSSRHLRVFNSASHAGFQAGDRFTMPAPWEAAVDVKGRPCRSAGDLYLPQGRESGARTQERPLGGAWRAGGGRLRFCRSATSGLWLQGPEHRLAAGPGAASFRDTNPALSPARPATVCSSFTRAQGTPKVG